MRVLLLTCLMLTIVMSGCVSKDISSVVNTLPEVQQYLKEHPDAKVAATFWPKDEVSKSLQEIDRQCGKSVTAVDMYRVIITEENLKIVSWVDANNKELICSLTEGGTKIETTGAISTPTTISTPLITPVTTYDVISTPMVTPTKMKATIVPTIVPIHTTIQTKSPTFTMSTENGVITIKGEVDKYQFIDRDTDIFYISEGLTTFNMNHKGDGNFMINMKDDKGNLVEVGIANEIGDYDGIKHIKVVRSGKYYLNIFADGSIGIVITQTSNPVPTYTSNPVPTYTSNPTPKSGSCDPSYPTVCIPSPPPDLNCKDIQYKNFEVLQPDPHGFDRDKDGIGCET